ncbi:threonine aldolase family protein [Propionicicella superfundia]|uniref:threonine aldolase family protein n=1 Tax=Propionicicella superfundia TaxID=348582 RepID=UPI000400B4CA|nr:GntG family PLP-dependent aldolase [Propionicicella superfundia]
MGAVVDLRSDTITLPTAEMRAAMAAADVGDDVYGEDPTLNAFESEVAELLGHEAGLFCPTGSLTNLLGVWLLVRPGEEVLCESLAHIARAEMGAHGAVHGVTMRTWSGPRGQIDLAAIAALAAPDAGPFLVSTAAVAIENTHNFAGGTVQSIEAVRELAGFCRDVGLGLHMDGARLWNASVATGVPERAYAEVCDTVSVCFSKGLGAPVGSMLLSSAENIARARVQRKRLGGGWRQAGVLAAAARHALHHHRDRLAVDHDNARAFAEAVAAANPAAVDVAGVATNIVVVATGDRPAGQVVAEAASRGVAISGVGARSVRAVTHLGVTADECRRAGEIVGAILAGRPSR